jgi:hypothetical protein
MRRGIPADARLLAYHEAGHAVAAYVLKRPLGTVSLEPPDPQPQSPDAAGRLDSLESFEDAERDVVVLLAGVEAEAVLTGDCDWFAAQIDCERAEALLGQMLAAGYRAQPRDEAEVELGSALGGDPLRIAWELLRRRTYALLRQAPVRTAITALATALLANSPLDSQQAQRAIRAGIAAADPELL